MNQYRVRRLLNKQAVRFLILAKALFCSPPFGNIFDCHQPCWTPRPFQIVRGDLHFDQASVLLSVPPPARPLEPLGSLSDAFQQRREILGRTNIPAGHAQELLARITVMVHGRLVDR